jgi:ATP-dependent DNA helicase RecQ
VFRKTFYRSNLAYVVYKEEDKLRKLLRVCNGVKGQGVVYVRNRRLTRETAEYLNRNGIKAGFYHAGLEPALRSSRQKEWMEERTRVMVATNAFGMGIDKPNVRFVVHLDLPENLEAYFQEAGRAGRDEKKAYAVILYNESDLMDTRSFHEQSWPEPEVIKQVYQALGNHLQLAVGSGKDISFDFNLDTFASGYNLKPATVFNSLRILERDGFLSFSDSENTVSKAYFLTNREELYKYQVEHRNADLLIKAMLRSYAGLFNDFTAINEYELARRLSTDRDHVAEQLFQLKKAGILEYIPLKNKPQIIFTTERVAPDNLGLSKTYYYDRKKEAKKKLEQMLSYVTQLHKCRSLVLLEYFGDFSGKPCMICDICIEGKNEKPLAQGEIEQILEAVTKAPLTLTELMLLFPSIKEKRVLKTIQWLVDEGRLMMDKGVVSTRSI